MPSRTRWQRSALEVLIFAMAAAAIAAAPAPSFAQEEEQVGHAEELELQPHSVEVEDDAFDPLLIIGMKLVSSDGKVVGEIVNVTLRDDEPDLVIVKLDRRLPGKAELRAVTADSVTVDEEGKKANLAELTAEAVRGLPAFTFDDVTAVAVPLQR